MPDVKWEIHRLRQFYLFDPLAQSVEHLTFNQGVPRSSRGWITKKTSSYYWKFLFFAFLSTRAVNTKTVDAFMAICYHGHGKLTGFFDNCIYGNRCPTGLNREDRCKTGAVPPL